MLLLEVLLGVLIHNSIAEENRRDGKVFPVFQVIRFPNDVCIASGSMNGTCYTAEECTTRNGGVAGSCADGFGVCCTFTLGCGESTSENNTYITQQPNTKMFCDHTIRPISSSISRVRLDLQNFVIAPPVLLVDQSGNAANTVTGNVANLIGTGSSIGDCLTDTFVVSGSGTSSPVICGTNSGQHILVDSDGMTPITATFCFGGAAAAAAATRQYTIQVTQFDQLNLMGGPPGCLQFYTGDTGKGTINTFNWVNTQSTHLSSQNYKACIRRNVNRCVICYSEAISFIGPTAPPAKQQGSFGLSVSSALNMVDARTDTACSGDYIEIPNGVMSTMAGVAAGAGLINNAIVTAGTGAGVVVAGGAKIAANIGSPGNDRFCGRCLGGTDLTVCRDPNTVALAAGLLPLQSICTRTTPFTLGVFTDEDEVTRGAGAGQVTMANLNEASAAAATMNEPLGTQGFSIGFAQLPC